MTSSHPIIPGRIDPALTRPCRDARVVHTRPAWDDRVERLALDRLNGDVTADVVVVGLGGSGLSAAIEAAERGLRVVGIDAGSVANGAAGRNGGFLLAGLAHFYHDLRDQVGGALARRFYRYTLDELDHMTEQAPESINRSGVLRLILDDDEVADCEQHRAALLRDGFDAYFHEGPQGKGLMIPSDGTFHPLARIRTLTERAVALGVQLFEHSPALDIAGNRVTTPGGVIEAGHVIVAVDGGLDRALPELADEVRTVRLQMVTTVPQETFRLQVPVYGRFGYDYLQQLPDGRIAMGGGRDVAYAEEETTDKEPTFTIQSYLCGRLAALGADARLERGWAASVGYTANRLPIVREVRPAVWAIGGYCGTGNIVGALLGRAVVDQIITGGNAVVADFQAAIAQLQTS